MNTVLIVAYYFPPIAASGSMRPLGFCRYLEDSGWRPRVLTASPDSLVPPQPGDEGLWKMVPRHLEVDSVPHDNPAQALIRLRNRVRQIIRTRASAGERGEPGQRSGPRAEDRPRADRGAGSQLKNLIFDWAFDFPDAQCRWYGPAVRRASRRRGATRPDVVFATGAPWTGLLVGRRLAARFQVPFVADFRDPWTLNPSDRGRFGPWLTRRAQQLERGVCGAASRIIVNTEEMREAFCLEHPELEGKCLTITNGFDTDALAEPEETGEPDGDVVRARDAPDVELCHFGSVYGERNPWPLLEAITELLREGRMRPRDLRIRFVGEWDVIDEECEGLACGLDGEGVLRREAPMSRDLCLRQMARSRCLLALQGNYPLQIPAKIYEYIAAGRPILVISGQGATARMVEEGALGTCCPNDVAAIKDLLWRLLTGRASIAVPPAKAADGFHYRAITGRLGEVLDVVRAESRR